MQINISWSAFKAFIDNRQVLVQYVLTDEQYFIWAVDDGTEVSCQIPYVFPTPPDSDQQDFEQNYLPYANKPLDRRSLTGALQVSSLLVDGSGNTVSFVEGALSATLVTSGDPYTTYSESLSVQSGVETIVLSYMVPSGMTFYLRHALGSGENIAAYTMYVDGSAVAKKRSWYTDFNVDFFFEADVNEGLEVLGSSVLELTVLHNSPMPGNFNASIFGQLQ
jgi:hypothetical protein